MMRIGIIIGSTRPGRKADAVARWVLEHAQTRGDAEYEVVDIAEYGLPLLDEPVPPSAGHYSQEHTRRWSAKIASLDAFVFVTPEYNHSTSGALKNAIDFLYREWNDKAAGFVAYGSAGGARAIEHLRGICGELMLATVRQTVMFSLATDFENWKVFKPQGEQHAKHLATMLDQLVKWAGALQACHHGTHEGGRPPRAREPHRAPSSTNATAQKKSG